MKTAVTTRVLAIVLCVVLIFGLAAGLWSMSDSGSTRIPYGEKNPNGIAADDIMITFVGMESVMAEEYFYYALSVRDGYIRQYGAEVFEAYPFMADDLLYQVDGLIISSNAYVLWGRQEGFELSAEDYLDFDELLRDLEDRLAEDNIDKEEHFLQNYMTEELFRRVYLRDVYIDKFFEEYMTAEHPFMAVTDAQIDDFARENGIYGAKHILINDEYGDRETQINTARELLERITTGEDFDTLMLEMTKDPGIKDFPDGYTFESGQAVNEFEDAALELEIGQVSEVVESEHGFHIIKRIDINRDGIRLQIQQDRILETRIDYEKRLDPHTTELRDGLVLMDMLPVM